MVILYTIAYAAMSAYTSTRIFKLEGTYNSGIPFIAVLAGVFWFVALPVILAIKPNQ